MSTKPPASPDDFIFDSDRWDRLAGEQPDDEESLLAEGDPDAVRLLNAPDVEADGNPD